jgi:DUF1680 family protein
MKRTEVRTWNSLGETVYIYEPQAFPFDSYSPLYRDRRGLRAGGVQFIGEGRSYGCCVCIGSAGVALLGLFSVMKDSEGLYVNFYNDTKFNTEMDGTRVKLDMRANPYEANGARIKVQGGGAKFPLALRVPTWAEGLKVKVNGEDVIASERNGYLVLERAWDTDIVELIFRASVKMNVINGKIAFTRGAVVLARDTRLGDINTPLNIKAKDGKTLRARRVMNTAFNSNIAVELKTKDGVITLCDYAQAGKNYDDEDTGVTVWNDKE